MRDWKCSCGNQLHQLGRGISKCPRCDKFIPWEYATIHFKGWVKRGDERGSRKFTEFWVFCAAGNASDGSDMIPISNPTGGDWGGWDNHYYIRGDTYDHRNPPSTPPQTPRNIAAVDALREEFTVRQGYEVSSYPNPRFREDWFLYTFRRVAMVYDDMSVKQMEEAVDILTTRAGTGRAEDLDTARQLHKLAKIIEHSRGNNKAARAINCLIAADVIYRQYGKYDSGLECLEQAAEIMAGASPQIGMGTSNPYVKMAQERQAELGEQLARKKEEEEKKKRKYDGCPLDSSDAVKRVSACGDDPQLRRRLAPPRTPGIRGSFSNDDELWEGKFSDWRYGHTRWQDAWRIWYRDLYYCPRHDIVYLPDSSRRPVPPERREELLY